MKENLGPAHQPQNVQARRRHYDKSFIGSTIIGKRFNRRSKQESGNIAKCPAHHKGESALQFSARAHKTAVFFIAINFCAMLRPPFFSILITETTPHAQSLRILYDGSAILIAIALLLLSRKENVLTLAEKPLPLPLLTSASTIGIACINLCEIAGSKPIALYSLGVLLISIGLVALTVGLFYQLSILPRKAIAPFILAAFVASHFLGFLDLPPRQAEIWAVALYPLSSSFLLFLCLSKNHLDSKLVESAHDSTTSLSTFSKQIRVLAIALIFIEILCGAFLRSSYAQGGIGYSASASTLFTYVVSAAIGILFYAAAKKAETATEGALTIGGMGLICFMIASFFLDVVPIGVLIPLITGTYSALIVFMAALIALWKHDGDVTVITCAGAFTMLYSSVTAITTTIAPQAVLLIGFVPAESYASFGAGAGLLASIGACVLLLITTCSHRESYRAVVSSPAQHPHSTSSTERNDNDTPLDKTNSIEKGADSPFVKADASKQINEDDSLRDLAVKLVAESFDLTERERQAVSLITKGYTARKVAEEMVVAISTVQGYCKSIYKKLGIHRKDDLIEIVEREMASIKNQL